jgi:acyl-CoA thioester hydrolase
MFDILSGRFYDPGMPRTYTRRFRVRSTDCDAAGHVNNAVYLRYLQEVAIEASADAGYDPAWYDAHGAGWVIRRSRIDYLQPLRYGDEIDVTTYVVDVRRVRSQRNYEIVRAQDHVMAARAATDWVFIDRREGTPARVPNDAPARFLPDGPVLDAERIADLPAPPDAPPPNAFHTTRRVYYYEIDEYQHVNNSVYLSYLEQAAIDAGAAMGFDMPQVIELGGAIVASQHDIEYLRPAQYGDTLDIATWIGEISRVSVLRHTTMRLQGELAIRAQTRWVWIDLKTRRPAAMPAAMREALAS